MINKDLLPNSLGNLSYISNVGKFGISDYGDTIKVTEINLDTTKIYPWGVLVEFEDKYGMRIALSNSVNDNYPKKWL